MSNKFGIKVRSHRNLRLNLDILEDRALADEISAAKSLLIIDDLVFTGSRLHTFNKALRESQDIFESPKHVTFFPLIVLAENNENWKKVVRGLRSHHEGQTREVMSLYEMPLPSWDKKLCPWCAERKSIEKLELFSSDDSDLRGTLLSQSDRGLSTYPDRETV